MKHQIKVTQVYRVERTTMMEVEADTADEAQGKIDDGEIDLPSYDDPCWSQDLKLITEYSNIVGDEVVDEEDDCDADSQGLKF